MINIIKKLLSNPVFVTSGIMTASLLFLASALTAEHVFGLQPCILCLYQRAPYVITALLGLLGLILTTTMNAPSKAAFIVVLAAIVFFGEAALAFYHVGVEQHWWISAFEGCKVTFEGDVQTLLEKIQSSQAVRCDEIPWQMFGISMAGYNVITALGMAIGSLISGILIMRKLNGVL